MASTIVTKNSSTASAVPVSGDLTQGELAVNVTDKKLYTKDSGGTVVKIVGGLGNQEANAVAITGGSINGTTVGATTASTGAFTTLSASSTVSGTGFSTYLASPPAIGGTAAAAGSFTTLSASSTTTLSGGTANGVAYLNGSKVVTTGSALTFTGSRLGIGESSPVSALTVKSGNGDQVALNNAGERFTQFTLQNNGTSKGALWVDNTNSLLELFGYTGMSLTFSANGTEGMRLTSTGLGIGTSSPQIQSWRTGTYLTVANASTRGQVEIDGAVADSGSASLGALIFTYSTNTTNHKDVALIEATSSGSTANQRGGVLSFYTKANGTASPALNMTLDSSGNLGLGVTPSAWSGQKALEFSYGALSAGTNLGTLLASNAYYNGTNWIYRITTASSYYLQDSAGHKWFYAPSGTAGNAITFTQAMTLDASGRLALGATSILGGSNIASFTNVTSAKGVLAIQNTSTSGYSAVELYDNSGAQQGAMGWGNGSVAVTGAASATYLYSTGAITFLSGGTTERARIDSSGNLLVGTTSTYYGEKFTVSQGAADKNTSVERSTSLTPYGSYIEFSAAAPNNTTRYFLQCVDNAAERMTVRSNGGIANYSANNVNLSDRREKTNFAPAGEYLSKICAIPVQTFNYIDQNLEEDPGTTLGVVAQDVQAVAPELVMESNWGTKDEPKMRLSIYQTDLQYALMKCIQEQQALIQQLQADVAALKGN